MMNLESINASASHVPSRGMISGFASYLERYQNLFFGFVLVTALFDLPVIARHTPAGTDALMARISAQSSSLWHMLKLLRDQPVNVDPPMFPVFAYAAARLPLPIDFAIRIPAM